MLKVIISSVFLVCLLGVSRVMAEPTAIHALADGFHAAAARSDFDGYFGHFSKHGYFLGTDASERWSVDEFKEYARAPFAEGRGWRYKVLERHVEQGKNNDVFWFDEVLLNDALGRCRGTGVVVKEGGQWKIAHYSLTLLIPNDIADAVGAASLKQDGLLQR